MGIREFIRDEIFAPSLRRRCVLVVYDPEKRYRDICRSMASDVVTVVDATDSSFESREAALKTLPIVAHPGASRRELLIYVPKRAPVSDAEKQEDPFAAYSTFGSLFPEGDGHEYLNICLRAKADHATEIRRLFAENPSPEFALIDNIGGGVKWPTLRTLLNVESARDILFALLVPTAKQRDALQSNATWVAEAKLLFETALGLKLITKGKSWSTVAEEMWRFLLYSEFCFDLPGDVPSALSNVPNAPEAARPTVEDLCERLRSDVRTRSEYILRAELIERELSLPEVCSSIEDLGDRATFPFEERTFLSGAVTALKQDRLDEVRETIHLHSNSVWLGKGESQAQWDLLRSALALVSACDDSGRHLDEHVHSLDRLIDFYVTNLSLADRLQREFEQAVGDYISFDNAMMEVVEHARGRYGKLIGRVQPAFTTHLEKVGWPPPGRLANVDVFDRFVDPLLKQSGRRVAYIAVDALRYELGAALFSQLGDGDASDIVAACAQLPTVTLVGMASLLPRAATGLHLENEGGSVVPMIDDVRLTHVNQRMDLLRARFGDRFAENTLAGFVGAKSEIPSTVSLYVLRDTEIDGHLESNPESTLGLLQQTLKRIRIAIRRLKDLGFDDVVVATDHGFFLNAHSEAGDLCRKPAGKWVNVHDRSLLGDGTGDSSNFALPANKAGIRGGFHTFAGPRSMAPYRRGLLYFHGGASLQEAIVPVLTVRLKREKQPSLASATVGLSYKNGAKKITTRLPVVELSLDSADIFSQAVDFEIQLEAYSKKGEVVGEAKPGGVVNAATRTIVLRPGQKEQITLRMAMEFEGKFTIKAMNPTTLMIYAMLDLETDYAV